MGYFKDSLNRHIFIELYYGYSRGILYEMRFWNNNATLLKEEYGIPNYIEETAYSLMQRCTIALEKGENSFIFSTPSCPFTESISVSITGFGNDCAYSVSDHSDNVSNGTPFKTIDLDISEKCIINNSVGSIIHELTHAYEDWCLAVKGLSLYDKVNNGNYISPLYGNDDLMEYLSNILYFFNKIEMRAYMSEISNTIKNADKKFSSIKDITEWLSEKSVGFSNYLSIMETCEILMSVYDKNIQDVILGTLNSIGNVKFTTYRQFVKWMSQRAWYFKNKFNTMVPKIIHKYGKFKHYMKSSDTGKIKKLDGSWIQK